jgi:hypothetical protein
VERDLFTETERTMTKNAPHPPRSSKAGRPPAEPRATPAVARRRKRAATAVRKDTMILEAAQGPRVLWGRAKPQVKKR